MPTYTVTTTQTILAASPERAREIAVDYFRTNFASDYPMTVTETHPVFSKELPVDLDAVTDAVRARWVADRAESIRLGYFTVQAYRNSVRAAERAAEDAAEACDECGAVEAHATSCSLHPANIIDPLRAEDDAEYLRTRQRAKDEYFGEG